MNWFRGLLLAGLLAAASQAAGQAGPPPGAESAVPDGLLAETGGAETAPAAPGPDDAPDAPEAPEGEGLAGSPPGESGPAEEVLEGPDAAVAPAQAAAGLPARSEIERIWLEPDLGFEERVAAVRRASLEYGVWSLDPQARAILAGSHGGNPLERGRAAVRLAPDLPAARIALARAIWLQAGSPLGALHAAWDGILAIPRHPAAALWFAGSGLAVLAVALVCGGLLSIGLAGILAAPHAAHDLADVLSRATPSFARAALLGALLLTPFACGEGPLGLALVLLALGCAYGARRQRIVLALAAAAVVLGAFPVARWAGSLLTALERDPVAEAAYAMAAGSTLESDVLRVAAVADSDALAARAMARLERRMRSLGQADARYQKLVSRHPDDWVVHNNAANVRLELGHLESALSLYQRAASEKDSAVVYYNLAQTFGRAFQVDDLSIALEHAQSLDGRLLTELAHLQGTEPQGFVVDLPLPRHLLWERIQGPEPGEPLAAELRRQLAPGLLGRSALDLCAGAAGACLLGSLVGSGIRRSRWCNRCGRRQCPRCDPESGGGAVCGACTRLFYQPEETHKARRLERIDRLRDRERRIEGVVVLSSLLLPGIAGLLARSPLRSLLGSLLFSLGAAAAFWRHGPVPDPWLAGGAAPFVFLHLTALCGLAYAAVVGTALAARRRL